MTSPASPHLTEDQLTDCMIEDHPDPGCQTHLAHCEECRLRLKLEREAFQTSIAGFNSASLAWSESRPSLSLRAKAASQAANSVYTPMRWALATVALALVALPIWNHDRRATPAGSQPAVSSPDDSASQIAQDNQLMQSVNLALARNEPSPFNEYRLTVDQPSRAAAADSRAR